MVVNEKKNNISRKNTRSLFVLTILHRFSYLHRTPPRCFTLQLDSISTRWLVFAIVHVLVAATINIYRRLARANSPPSRSRLDFNLIREFSHRKPHTNYTYYYVMLCSFSLPLFFRSFSRLIIPHTFIFLFSTQSIAHPINLYFQPHTRVFTLGDTTLCFATRSLPSLFPGRMLLVQISINSGYSLKHLSQLTRFVIQLFSHTNHPNFQKLIAS